MTREPDDPRDESPYIRADRNLSELLQELRVALPGVQVVFAFLLTVPFAQRFKELDGFQKAVYFATLLLTAVTTALLVAPSANHRLLFRKHDKEHLVIVANRLTVAGLVTMALSMCGAILLVSDFMFDALVAGVATGALLMLFAVLWVAAPLRRRRRVADAEDPPMGTQGG